MKTAASAGRTRPARGPAPTAHERTPQQERQKAAREAERGREAWTLGQGMKKPVAGCYGRLTRWKGEGCCLHGSAVVSGLRSGSGPDQSSPFLGPSTFLTTSLLFRQSIDNHRESLLERCVRTGFVEGVYRGPQQRRAEPVQRCRRARRHRCRRPAPQARPQQ